MQKAITEFPALLREIERCIGRTGEVLDAASPALGTVRGKLKVTRNRVEEKLSNLLSSSTFRPMLMETNVVLRDGRRCLAVKAEHKRAFGGIVHDQSATGATLFMEPMALVDLNNQLRQHEIEERQEVAKVLQKLTDTVQKQIAPIHSTVEVIGGLDLASAKANLAADMRAVAPKFNKDGRIIVREARHPLLNPETVVPVTLSFGTDTNRALLITGPNTGGKTVSLKTVGLFVLMAQAGLQVPARDAELAHFDQIFADIGDEQSIQQNLSTFSAHITNIVRILRSVGKKALVLLDEMGAGTDPAEGAALAKAILTYLLDHNARIIATTHYGELKEFAYSRKGIENAAVEFDKETLKPTYRLLQGVPGSSHAFHIARKLGVPNRVVDAALANMDSQITDTTAVMHQLEEAKRAAEEERRKAERLSAEIENLKVRYEARLEDLELLRREAKVRVTEEANQLIRQKTEKMNNIIGELRRVGKEGRKTQSARKRMKETTEELIGGIGVENIPLPVDETEIPASLSRGDKVKILSLGGAVGEVSEDSSGKEALVQMGAMRMTVPMSTLRLIDKSGNVTVFGTRKGTDKLKKSDKSASHLALKKAQEMTTEIRLMGMRGDAALPRLDKYLDDALASEVESVRVVHGKGTGQLRKMIWEFLKGDARVNSYVMAHPEEGGAGVTVVKVNV